MRLRSLAAVAVSVALAAVLSAAGPAAAHEALVSATPAADSTVAGDVDEVALTLSGPPLAGLETGIVISVTGPDGAEATSGAVRVEGDTIAKRVDLTAAGSYAVAWRSVSVDGHPISGTYRFASTGAVAAPAPTGAPSATASANASTTADAAVRPGAEPTASSAPLTAGHQHGSTGTLWFLGGLAVLVVVAVLVTRAVTRRRAGDADGSADTA